MEPAQFLDVSAQFQLGMLDTERPHPRTRHLSDWARGDLPRAIAALREVDRDALEILHQRFDSLTPLRQAIRATLDAGKSLYLCGCGATGRLSIALEILARQGLLPGASEDNVIGFMAGGDAALIRSIERFEDHPEYGERQLKELGFGDGDLLIASTEGGETPFVIGAAEAAAGLSGRSPFFLYCNPDEILCRNVERSRRVIEDGRIHKINLAVGPMALSGSTRMQASTVLMAAIGFAMAQDPSATTQTRRSPVAAGYDRWRRWVSEELDWSFLADFIRAESEIYSRGDYVIYEPGPYGITVLTDTTERSPTFTLAPFERAGSDDVISLCYLQVPGSDSAESAWNRLLERGPRALEWGDQCHLTGQQAIRQFDFSPGTANRRDARTGRRQFRFQISRCDGCIRWRFRNWSHTFAVPEGVGALGENLALKLLLNAHSTLVMGQMGRYEDNLMTYVTASNFKLMDRSIRYARLLLERHHGVTPDYETVARVLLSERETLAAGEPIVLRVVEKLAHQ